jgi:hypothetical protein
MAREQIQAYGWLMKIKIAVLTILCSSSMWAVAQTNGAGGAANPGANDNHGFAAPGGSGGFVTPGKGFVTPGGGFIPPGNGFVVPGHGFIAPGSSNHFVAPGNGFVTPGSSNRFVMPGNGFVAPDATNGLVPPGQGNPH